MTKETTSTYMSIRPYKVGQFTRARVRAYIIVNNTKLYGNWSDYSYNATSSKVTLKRSANKKKITVKWKKVKGVAGYTVYVSTKSNGGWKKVKNYGKKATKAIITKYGKKKLSKNKTYYVKVAYMIKVKGKKITSSIYSTGAAY